MGDAGAMRWTVEGTVARVTIDQPPVNIVGGDLIVGLHGLFADLEGHEINVAVFRSADPDFFLMHGDVELLAGVGPSEYSLVTEPNLAAATLQRLRTGP